MKAILLSFASSNWAGPTCILVFLAWFKVYVAKFRWKSAQSSCASSWIIHSDYITALPSPQPWTFVYTNEYLIAFPSRTECRWLRTLHTAVLFHVADCWLPHLQFGRVAAQTRRSESSTYGCVTHKMKHNTAAVETCNSLLVRKYVIWCVLQRTEVVKPSYKWHKTMSDRLATADWRVCGRVDPKCSDHMSQVQTARPVRALTQHGSQLAVKSCKLRRKNSCGTAAQRTLLCDMMATCKFTQWPMVWKWPTPLC